MKYQVIVATQEATTVGPECILLVQLDHSTTVQQAVTRTKQYSKLLTVETEGLPTMGSKMAADPMMDSKMAAVPAPFPTAANSKSRFYLLLSVRPAVPHHPQ